MNEYIGPSTRIKWVGQNNVLVIGMAMSCNPDILIADAEPTTSPDVTVKYPLELMANLN
ncbi:MAG: hypothetical protein IPO03_03380 [Bacteroidetes bacterium]|nr:hypothetical protein [Bacteroidota bacterium]